MRVKKYAEFILENENIKDDIDEKGIVKLPVLKTVVDKDFFNELKEHIQYWFAYDFLKDKYELIEINKLDDEIKITFQDKVGKKDPDYMYMVRYITSGNSDMDQTLVDKIEKVKMMATIYRYSDNMKLKEVDNLVDVEFLNAKSFNRIIEKVKNRIIIAPTDKKDVEKFRDKERRRLQDDVY